MTDAEKKTGMLVCSQGRVVYASDWRPGGVFLREFESCWQRNLSFPITQHQNLSLKGKNVILRRKKSHTTVQQTRLTPKKAGMPVSSQGQQWTDKNVEIVIRSYDEAVKASHSKYDGKLTRKF